MFFLAYRRLLLLFLFIIAAQNSWAQSTFSVYVTGIKPTDSVLIIVQQKAETKQQKWAKYVANQSTKLDFQLSNGKYALIIDAKGYTFPAATTFDVPTQTSATVTLTPMLGTDFTYKWRDDDSFAGHATQTYVNEPSVLKVLDSTLKVPSDFSSIKIRNEFGIVLSNEKEKWSSEDSFRLYSILKTIPIVPFGEGTLVDFETGKNIQAVFHLTKSEQFKDITIVSINGIKNVTISQSAFVYASTQVGNLDGIKVRFYSKRLHHAVLNYFTDFGANKQQVDRIAQEKYGIRFMESNQETQTLMKEDASNFQEFFDEEKINILSMFEELPEGMHKQEGLKYLVRRVNGQDHPIYTVAPAIAWAGFNTIEFMSKAFNQTDIGYVQRLILHEKAHLLWAYSFDQKLKDDWAILGGWFIDPTTSEGWSTYNTTEFVSAYAHQKNPNEDMAESIAAYVTNPDILMSRSVRKYEFIRDRVMHGTRYKAQIRQDLTFMVYNLYPDYVYPGKIIGLNIDVKGKADEDKEVTIEFKLNSKQPSLDGASVGYIRLASTIGTIHDIWLSPKNGKVDSVLVGKTIFSKHEKNGYWNIVSLRVEDPVGNSRMENTSTIGFKLYLESPLEDIAPPKWKYDLKLELGRNKFNFDGTSAVDANTGIEMQRIKAAYSFYDNSPLLRSITRFYFPKLDKPGVQIYEMQIQDRPVVDPARQFTNTYNSIKNFEMSMAVPDYYPSGYYSVSMLNVEDVAGNYTTVNFMKDTANYSIPLYLRDNGLYKDKRDSIYVSTPHPDYIAPEIDLNRIRVVATPTNPTSPDGETRVDISLLARDLSDHPGFEAGVKHIGYVLRDPTGKEFHFSSWNDNLLFNYFSIKADGNSSWKPVKLNVVLPKGSAPGKWGISAMQTLDRAGNFRNYSFVEIVRFDVVESDIVLTAPLNAKILNKFVNKNSVDSIAAEISCVPCKDKKFVYQIYSLMGGNVARGEGVLSNDTSIINNISVRGVLDGVIYLTVQVLDNSDQLIATKTAVYTKDTVLPKAYLLKTNLQNQGYSNLDDLVIKVALELADINGNYNLKFSSVSPKPPGTASHPASSNSAINLNSSSPSTANATKFGNSVNGSANSVLNSQTSAINNNISQPKPNSTQFGGLSSTSAILLSSNSGVQTATNELTYTGQITDSLINLNHSKLKDLADGIIKAQLLVVDSSENVGSVINYYFHKKITQIKYIGTELLDGDNDGVYDFEDSCLSGVNPIATITAGGSLSICQGGKVTLTANSSSSYLWSNGATTQSIEVSTAGNYTVTLSNANGCSATSTATAVVVNALPTATITASGATTFCTGGSVTLTASSGSSYLWSNGATTQSIIINNTGNYSVTVTNANGCLAASAATTVTVNSLPTATISASGPTSFCQGGKVTLTANSSSSYLWSNGATTQSIEVSTAGNYTVTLSNANGCSATSTATAVVVNALPTATITASGPLTISQTGNVVLSTASGHSYQWHRDGLAIAGATANSYTATTAGSYTVKVTTSSGCEALSTAMAVKTIFVLPANNFQISITGETCRVSDNGKIVIGATQSLSYTATLTRSGQTIKTSTFSSNLELTGLAAGNYTLCITIAGQVDYKQCYEILITEPKDLTVYANSDRSQNIVNLTLSGGSTYYISINGKLHTSTLSNVSLPLNPGINRIVVKTDKECQGIFTEDIYLDSSAKLYPNPFVSTLNIRMDSQNTKEALVRVLDVSGAQVYQAIHRVVNGQMSLDLSKLAKGYYYIVIGKQTYKVIKQ